MRWRQAEGTSRRWQSTTMGIPASLIPHCCPPPVPAHVSKELGRSWLRRDTAPPCMPLSVPSHRIRIPLRTPPPHHHHSIVSSSSSPAAASHSAPNHSWPPCWVSQGSRARHDRPVTKRGQQTGRGKRWEVGSRSAKAGSAAAAKESATTNLTSTFIYH